MPTREPIACGWCHHVHSGVRCTAVVFGDTACNCMAPQPTAQAGEACKTCNGEGRIFEPAKDNRPGTRSHIYACPNCDGTGKVPAPPTPTHEEAIQIFKDSGMPNMAEAGRLMASSAGEGKKYVGSLLGVDIISDPKATEPYEFRSPLKSDPSPQLPTPEPDSAIHGEFKGKCPDCEARYEESDYYCPARVRDLFAEQAQLYNQRFEAAIGEDKSPHYVEGVYTGKEDPFSSSGNAHFNTGWNWHGKEARSRWYAPTPNTDKGGE